MVQAVARTGLYLHGPWNFNWRSLFSASFLAVRSTKNVNIKWVQVSPSLFKSFKCNAVWLIDSVFSSVTVRTLSLCLLWILWKTRYRTLDVFLPRSELQFRDKKWFAFYFNACTWNCWKPKLTCTFVVVPNHAVKTLYEKLLLILVICGYRHLLMFC